MGDGFDHPMDSNFKQQQIRHCDPLAPRNDVEFQVQFRDPAARYARVVA